MGLVLLLVVLVAVSLSPARSQTASTCAATLCQKNTICREILDRASGVVSARCLDPNLYPPTGREQICSNGQPLWIANDNKGYSQAACGRVVDRTTCPNSHTCVIAPNDVYSLCCPNSVAPVKSGECPVVPTNTFGICANTCKLDSECQGDLKCCRNPCGAFTCQKRKTDSCKSIKCKPGFVCKEDSTGGQCVYATKEGKCPAIKRSNQTPKCRSSCSTDADCNGDQKCCLANLFCKSCRDPQPSQTCENTKCNRGQKCIMQKVQCIRAPCFDIPTCVDL